MPPIVFDYQAIKERCDELSPHTLATGRPEKSAASRYLEELEDFDDPPEDKCGPIPVKKGRFAMKKKGP